VVSVASFPVTLVAAGVAVWQAKAAKDQVREAWRSATAAEDQVEIMRRQHNERDAERRNRKKAQATLVTIEVLPPVVKITNHSEQQVRELHIESIINAPVRWGVAGSTVEHRQCGLFQVGCPAPVQVTFGQRTGDHVCAR
jgi:hypothetical protein